MDKTLSLRPDRPRRRVVDVIDVGFRVSGSLGGLGLCLFMVVFMATSPIRSAEWLIAACLVTVPMTVAFGFSLLSWAAMRADRRAVRAERMQISFSPIVRVGTTRE